MGAAFLSNYFAQQCALNMKNGAGVMPSTIYMTQWSAAMTAAFSSGTEIVTAGQSRIELPCDDDNWECVDGVFRNKNAIRFLEATAQYTVVAVSGMFASSAGNAVFGQVLTTPKVIPIGDYYELPAGEVEIVFKYSA